MYLKVALFAVGAVAHVTGVTALQVMHDHLMTPQRFGRVEALATGVACCLKRNTHVQSQEHGFVNGHASTAPSCTCIYAS